MNNDGLKVLCSISTRGRYDTTLTMAIQSVITQTRTPDKLVIFDDNDPPKDIRNVQTYQYLFQMLDLKNIRWEWVYAERRGQHFNHDKAQKMAAKEGYDWIWRLDDDTIAESNVLAEMISYISNDSHGDEGKIGAIGGAILTPPLFDLVDTPITGKIEHIYTEPNIQWNYIQEVKSLDHLHCSFMYRANVYDFDLRLSRIAHREETLFTYGIKKKGYEILVIPNCVTWHLKNKVGGIRDGIREMFEHDEQIFRDVLANESPKDNKIVVLDCGMGDHIVFSHVLPDMPKDTTVFTCYPEIVPGKSIMEAKTLLGFRFDEYNIYRKMDEWNWKGSLEDAFRKLYGAPKK